ncbi:MAG: response regulator [Treponema sp.]|jgi:signal transduction histidine kinase/DNA-binding response OmpR family regulator|nr:response regulator [Treponema sp.]
MRKAIKYLLSSQLPYAQMLCVFLAFTVMGTATFLLAVNTERQHSKNYEEALSIEIEERLTTNLHELKTFISVVSETIRSLLLRGADFEEVKAYITEMTNFGLRENGGINGFGVIFAMFDVFDGAGINGLVPDLDWEKDIPDYVPQERPWYITADKSNGEIVETNPYVDALSHEVSFTYARCIYDNSGSRLAIICMDILLSNINKISSEHPNLGIHSWMMLDRNLNIISYPFEEFLGMSVREAKGSGIEDIADRLEQGLPVLSHKFVNPVGEKRIYSVRQTKNGWYIGVSTPVDSYYANIKNILWFLVVFGLFMSVGLSAILLRIVAQKNKIEKRTQIMLDSSPFAVNFFDKNFKVIDNNLAALKMFDIYDKEEYSRNFFNFSPVYQPGGALSSDLQREFLETASIEGRNQFEWVHQKSNGELLPVEVTIVNSTYEGKDIFIAHMRDLRETRAAIAEKNKAEESSRHKSAFLANMSHEIRTPMNAILGIAEIQLQNKAIPGNFAEAFSKIYESGDLLLNIINDILDISKIEAGRLELSLAKYDIPSLINDTVQLNILRYDSKPIDFTLNVDENTPVEFFGDELRIKQILNNIISNAFKYTDEGNIEFYVCAEPAQPADAAHESAGEDVIISFRVSDTGQGMTEEQVASLFKEEYTRFNIEANRETVGTGLGMSITKRLLDIMNGTISVHSEPGKGSVFTVRLPQKRIGQAVCGSELAEKLHNFRFQSIAPRKKAEFMREHMPYGSVLVVDDVKSNIYVIKGMLLPYGLKIDSVSNGFDAIKKIEDGNVYDIVFMDHMMPKMDGIEAVKILRGMGYSKTIIALTANALSGQEKMFLDNGFDGFISKPIDSRVLNRVLNEFIRDIKPIEVIEAAGAETAQLSDGRQPQNGTVPDLLPIAAQRTVVSNELAEATIHDIENALTVLEELLPRINSQAAYGSTAANIGEDLQLFAITVHGVKSAFANIGEMPLSNAAFKLEEAAKNGETKVIFEETPEFLNSLRSLMKKLNSREQTPKGLLTT